MDNKKNLLKKMVKGKAKDGKGGPGVLKTLGKPKPKAVPGSTSKIVGKLKDKKMGTVPLKPAAVPLKPAPLQGGASSGGNSSGGNPTSTKTATETSTETSTDAYTQGNITVTGGAGAGDTIVTIKGSRPISGEQNKSPERLPSHAPSR